MVTKLYPTISVEGLSLNSVQILKAAKEVLWDGASYKGVEETYICHAIAVVSGDKTFDWFREGRKEAVHEWQRLALALERAIRCAGGMRALDGLVQLVDLEEDEIQYQRRMWIDDMIEQLEAAYGKHAV